MTAQTPYRIFEAFLAERHMLTPNMARLVFSGPELADMTTCAPDQRIKLFFPKADGTPPMIPNRPDWYQLYKSEPPAARAPMRTYTIRAMDPSAGRLTVDFVTHGDNGPASRWALGARPGDRLQISAPNRRFEGVIGGFDWEPPAALRQLLVIADETALPAAAGILEQVHGWPQRPRADVFIEIPCMEDAQPLPEWDGLRLHWMPRAPSDAYGALMLDAALHADIPASARQETQGELEAIDVDHDVLWDRANDSADGDFYGWIAGETAAVSAIRTHFIKERAVSRNKLTMMGYWRFGKAHS